MDAFEQALLRYFAPDELKKIKRSKIVVLGAGGLGSNCASCLVRSGFCQLTLVDFDTVEPSNLNRQFFFFDQIGKSKVEALAENLRRIHRDLMLTLHRERITRDNLALLTEGSDVVVEAVDGAETKKLIAEFCLSHGKMLVSASGMCGVSGSDAIQTRRLGNRFYIVGDFTSSLEAGDRPYAPKVTMVAAKQAALVLEYCLTGTCRIESE